MIDIEATLAHLRSHAAETEVLEFKEAKNNYSFQKLGKYFSALANEANLLGRKEAWLVFGVKDSNKSIVNTRYRSEPGMLDRLKLGVADKTTNRISFKEIYAVETPEGRVILFQIPAAPRGIPVAWEGHYYGREGESLAPLNLEELERIRRQSRGGEYYGLKM